MPLNIRIVFGMNLKSDMYCNMHWEVIWNRYVYWIWGVLFIFRESIHND